MGTLYVCPHTVHATMIEEHDVIVEPLSLTQALPHSQVILITSIPIVAFRTFDLICDITLTPVSSKQSFHSARDIWAYLLLPALCPTLE